MFLKNSLKLVSIAVISAVAISAATSVPAQDLGRVQPPGAPVIADNDHGSMLASNDPVLEANKRLVYDFYRIVFEAGNVDRAGEFMAENTILHSPIDSQGISGVVELVAKFSPEPSEPQERMGRPLVAIVAESDLVTMIFVEYVSESLAISAYTTTWFDTFRVKDGKVVEHWDAAKFE